MHYELPPENTHLTFEEYKSESKASYATEKLSHYFNNEVGVVSNLHATIRSRILSSRSNDPAQGIVPDIDRAIHHLATVHEIGNIGLDILLERENRK